MSTRKRISVHSYFSAVQASWLLLLALHLSFSQNCFASSYIFYVHQYALPGEVSYVPSLPYSGGEAQYSGAVLEKSFEVTVHKEADTTWWSVKSLPIGSTPRTFQYNWKSKYTQGIPLKYASQSDASKSQIKDETLKRYSKDEEKVKKNTSKKNSSNKKGNEPKKNKELKEKKIKGKEISEPDRSSEAPPTFSGACAMARQFFPYSENRILNGHQSFSVAIHHHGASPQPPSAEFGIDGQFQMPRTYSHNLILDGVPNLFLSMLAHSMIPAYSTSPLWQPRQNFQELLGHIHEQWNENLFDVVMSLNCNWQIMAVLNLGISSSGGPAHSAFFDPNQTALVGFHFSLPAENNLGHALHHFVEVTTAPLSEPIPPQVEVNAGSTPAHGTPHSSTNPTPHYETVDPVHPHTGLLDTATGGHNPVVTGTFTETQPTEEYSEEDLQADLEQIMLEPHPPQSPVTSDFDLSQPHSDSHPQLVTPDNGIPIAGGRGRHWSSSSRTGVSPSQGYGSYQSHSHHTPRSSGSFSVGKDDQTRKGYTNVQFKPKDDHKPRSRQRDEYENFSPRSMLTEPIPPVPPKRIPEGTTPSPAQQQYINEIYPRLFREYSHQLAQYEHAMKLSGKKPNATEEESGDPPFLCKPGGPCYWKDDDRSDGGDGFGRDLGIVVLPGMGSLVK